MRDVIEMVKTEGTKGGRGSLRHCSCAPGQGSPPRYERQVRVAIIQVRKQAVT